jgi:hypothetical protein
MFDMRIFYHLLSTQSSKIRTQDQYRPPPPRAPPTRHPHPASKKVTSSQDDLEVGLPRGDPILEACRR